MKNFNIAIKSTTNQNIFDLLYLQILMIFDNLDTLWWKYPMFWMSCTWYINYIILYNSLNNKNIKRLFADQSRSILVFTRDDVILYLSLKNIMSFEEIIKFF